MGKLKLLAKILTIYLRFLIQKLNPKIGIIINRILIIEGRYLFGKKMVLMEKKK